MNPMERFRSNLKVACMLKIEPETWFSPHLSAYIRDVASYYQVDAHAMVLAIINGITSTCRSTYVNRTSHFMVPCNLYNILVARSGYSKSNILDLAQLIGETAAVYFQQSEENKEDEIREENSSEISGSSVVSTATTKNVLRKSIKVVFNDGTPAGILNNLKQCARTMHLREADVTLKSFGLLLPSSFDITPSKVDSFRSTLMTLHEKPSHFCRILKNEEIDISGSKLSIFGASTGDLVAAESVRQTASLSADALFERFLLWPLDGELIPNEKCITSIDYSQFCSLEQFSVLCGFFADLILELEPNGKQILADQGIWKNAIQTKLKRKRYEHRDHADVQHYQSKYSRYGSGRPVKEMTGEVAQRDRQKQILLTNYDDDTLNSIQMKVNQLRDDSAIDINARVQLWKETIHVRRKNIRERPTSEIVEEFSRYADPILIFEEVKMTMVIDLRAIVRQQIPVSLDKMVTTTAVITDSPPIQLIRVLCRQFEESVHHIYCNSVSVFMYFFRDETRFTSV
ncbi:unnamed protein product [Rotaria sordida]|uniref:DUF3987 domain-containing protein n=1 Tax=Rotaria sordida TaxID=392033 RepID=A0A818YDX5_9BILA|nr:unnamed protein product [Rotaria sordida]